MLTANENDSNELDNIVDEFLKEFYSIKDLDDSIMLRECINNYTDSLCKDGVISDQLYNKYEYGGEFYKYTL